MKRQELRVKQLRDKELRARGRFLCADLVRLSVGAETEPREALLEDISEDGVCLQLEQEIEPGTEVTFAKDDKSFRGTVEYCVWRDYGFFAGVKLADQSPWSASAFRPDYLMNPLALVNVP